MALEEYKGVFVFAQQVDNVLDGVAFELLGKGKDLAKDLKTKSRFPSYFPGNTAVRKLSPSSKPSLPGR